MPGFELLFATLKLTSKNDAVVALLHWIFLNEGCLCEGSGDDAQDGESLSELVPADWNQNQALYTLRYVNKNGKKYVVKCIPVDECLLINFTGLEGEKATAMTLNAEEYIDDFTRFQKTYRNLELLTKTLKNEVVNEVLHPKKSVAFEEEPEAKARSPEEERRHRRQMLASSHPHYLRGPNIGAADLLPGDLGFGGGGMLMNPRDLGRVRDPRLGPHGIGPALPRGAVPPGARFDPFGPPMPGREGRPGGHRFGVPDPDHLPPPGGYDDMFG